MRDVVHPVYLTYGYSGYVFNLELHLVSMRACFLAEAENILNEALSE